MHATYMFLVDATKEPGIAGKDFAEQITDKFYSDYDRYMDDNNWSQPLLLLTKDGTVYPLVPNEDWRGRDSWPSFVRQATPKPKRWDWAIHFVATLFAIDAELGGAKSIWFEEEPVENVRIDALTSDEIFELFCAEVPSKLATFYSSVVDKTTFDRFDLDEYRASKLAMLYHAVIRSCSYDRWFCSPTSPYDNIRGIDLTCGEIGPDNPNAGILFVDIHT
jgi:hypothetical protein